MKILFIDFMLPYLLKDLDYPTGGWAVELNSWITGLRANGQQVGVLTWKGANRFIAKRPDFDLIETYDPAKGIKVFKYFYYYIPSIYKKAAEYKPDVIIQACAGINTGIMCLIAKALKIPFLYRVANDMDTDHRYKDRLKGYEQIAYSYGLKKSRAVLCQNNYQLNQIRKKYPEKPAVILHNPFYQSLEVAPSNFEDRKYIAWVGIFQKQKNLPLLFEIARQMPHVQFQIAGASRHDLDSATEAAIMNLSKLPNVKFNGFLNRHQIIQFLNNAVALLNTSHYEGFSNTYLEAFSTGTPVICPSHADPDNIVKEEKLGYPCEHPSDFINAIGQIFVQKQSFDILSERCRKYVNINHNPTMLAKQLIGIITKLQ